LEFRTLKKGADKMKKKKEIIKHVHHYHETKVVHETNKISDFEKAINDQVEEMEEKKYDQYIELFDKTVKPVIGEFVDVVREDTEDTGEGHLNTGHKQAWSFATQIIIAWLNDRYLSPTDIPELTRKKIKSNFIKNLLSNSMKKEKNEKDKSGGEEVIL
jgi:hypothetical protein